MNEAKIDKLVEYIEDGGSLDQEDLAEVLGLSPKSVKSINNYLEAAAERLEDDTLEIGGDNPWSNDSAEADEEDDEEEEEEDEDEEEEDPEPEPELAPKKKPKGKLKDNSPFRFFLDEGNGISTEIQQTMKNGKVITFKKIEPTDIVQLMIKGEIVEVDIIPLRKEDPTVMSDYGITNEKLLSLALAAK